MPEQRYYLGVLQYRTNQVSTRASLRLSYFSSIDYPHHLRRTRVIRHDLSLLVEALNVERIDSVTRRPRKASAPMDHTPRLRAHERS